MFINLDTILNTLLNKYINIKKIIFIYFLVTSLIAENRPKVALVLSGGGLKGIAQIPLLKAIDSLNIPIDYVIGTSIGSINGALYSMVYSPEEILKIAYTTNWETIFSNKKWNKFSKQSDFDFGKNLGYFSAEKYFWPKIFSKINFTPKQFFFSELKKKLRYSFDAERVDLSIGGIFRLIGDL